MAQITTALLACVPCAHKDKNRGHNSDGNTDTENVYMNAMLYVYWATEYNTSTLKMETVYSHENTRCSNTENKTWHTLPWENRILQSDDIRHKVFTTSKQNDLTHLLRDDRRTANTEDVLSDVTHLPITTW